jgi:hypothetical protein
MQCLAAPSHPCHRIPDPAPFRIDAEVLGRNWLVTVVQNFLLNHMRQQRPLLCLILGLSADNDKIW